MTDGGPANADIARRLMALRTALGLNLTAFSRRTGIPMNTLSNYESGLRRPELDKAVMVVNATGATLDWIYLGARAGLPGHLLEKIAPFLGRQQAG